MTVQLLPLLQHCAYSEHSYLHKLKEMQGTYLLRHRRYFLPSAWPATLGGQQEDKHQLPAAGLVVNLLMTNSSRCWSTCRSAWRTLGTVLSKVHCLGHCHLLSSLFSS